MPRRSALTVLVLLGALAVAALAVAASRHRPPRFSMSARTTTLSAVPGGAALWFLRTSPARGRVRIAVRGVPRGWKVQWRRGPRQVEPELAAGQSTVRLRIVTPRSASPGVHRLEVTAEGRRGRASVGLVLRIAGVRALGVSGSLAVPLVPGRRVPLELTLRNPEPFAVRLVALSVRVDPRTSRAGCSGAANFRVLPAAGLPLRVPPGRWPLRRLRAPAAWPQVEMLDLPVSQDACQATRLTLHYAARATR